MLSVKILIRACPSTLLCAKWFVSPRYLTIVAALWLSDVLLHGYMTQLNVFTTKLMQTTLYKQLLSKEDFQDENQT